MQAFEQRAKLIKVLQARHVRVLDPSPCALSCFPAGKLTPSLARLDFRKIWLANAVQNRIGTVSLCPAQSPLHVQRLSVCYFGRRDLIVDRDCWPALVEFAVQKPRKRHSSASKSADSPAANSRCRVTDIFRSVILRSSVSLDLVKTWIRDCTLHLFVVGCSLNVQPPCQRMFGLAEKLQLVSCK